MMHLHPVAIGFNCALGAKDLRPHLEEVSGVAPTWITCHPNAGLPNEFGEYDETPEFTEEMARQARKGPPWKWRAADALRGSAKLLRGEAERLRAEADKLDAEAEEIAPAPPATAAE